MNCRPRKWWSSLFVVLFLFINNNVSVLAMKDDVEWKVKKGDSIIYVFTKYLNLDAENHSEEVIPLVSDEGKLINITFKVGLEVKCVVTGFTENDSCIIEKNYASYGTFTDTMLNTVLFDIQDLVSKTTTNNTFLQEYIERRTEAYELNQTNWKESIEGRYLIKEILYEPFFVLKIKRDLKTGWISNYYRRSANATHVTYEEEYSSESKRVTGFALPLTLITIYVIVILRKKAPLTTKT